MKTQREKLIWKRWKNMNIIQRNAAKKELIKGQVPNECEYGYNAKGELMKILDYGALSEMFSIPKVILK